MTTSPPGVDSARALLVGREISAVAFVRDYVELHFDGPILRAISNPFGHYLCAGWQFPSNDTMWMLRGYIGLTVEGFRFEEGQYLAVDSGENSFVVPLDDEHRHGPEAAHIVGINERGQTDSRHLWVW